MKTFKLFALLLTMSLGLSACDPIKGTLRVLQAFTAQVGSNQPCQDHEWPCQNQPSVETIPVGDHKMKIDMVGRDLIQINLKTNRGTKLIEMNVPRGKEIPATGNFSLVARESGQPFDLHGQTQTTVARSEEIHTEERCEVPHQEYVCGVVGHPPQHTCWYETHYRPGRREVSYYNETTDQSMKAQLHQNSVQVAVFDGSRSETKRIYTYQGYCRPYYW